MRPSQHLTRRLVASTLLFAATAASAGVVNHNVTVGGAGLIYTPAILNIAAGDTVTFTNAGGFHNVVSNPGAVTTFRCATSCVGTGGDASSTAWSVVVTFPTPGTVGYFCDIHGAPGQGMFGTINVTVPVSLQKFDIE